MREIGCPFSGSGGEPQLTNHQATTSLRSAYSRRASGGL